MRFLVTFGPTYEPLDEVRRLTNFSTGRLGTELTNFFVEQGHAVTAFRGYYSTHFAPLKTNDAQEFTTTENLLNLLRERRKEDYDAIFHAAAVSDFRFGQVFERDSSGALTPLKGGKFSTRSGTLLAELVPTPKIIPELRLFFPRARLFGWKYEVDGNRTNVLAAAKKQLHENKTDYCIVNGRAWGDGFGLVASSGAVEEISNLGSLCEALLHAASEV